MSDLKDINDKLFINTFKTVIRIISIMIIIIILLIITVIIIVLISISQVL